MLSRRDSLSHCSQTANLLIKISDMKRFDQPNRLAATVVIASGEGLKSCNCNRNRGTEATARHESEPRCRRQTRDDRLFTADPSVHRWTGRHTSRRAKGFLTLGAVEECGEAGTRVRTGRRAVCSDFCLPFRFLSLPLYGRQV